MLLGQYHLNEQHLGIYCSSGPRLKRMHIMSTYNECMDSGREDWAVEFDGENLGIILIY